MKIKKNLEPLVHLTLNQVELRRRNGLISDLDYLGYMAIRRWSGPWFGEPFASIHEDFFLKFGYKKYYDRINKVRAACGFDLIKGF